MKPPKINFMTNILESSNSCEINAHNVTQVVFIFNIKFGLQKCLCCIFFHNNYMAFVIIRKRWFTVLIETVSCYILGWSHVQSQSHKTIYYWVLIWVGILPRPIFRL